MIEITIQQFEQKLPFVGAASEDVFAKTEVDFEQSYMDLVSNVIGEDFEKYASDGTLSPLYSHASTYVLLDTFISRLHSQDIIMTDTGFGVVSNENIAPASQARVDALEKELTYNRDRVLQGIITDMQGIEGWSESEQAKTTIRSFVWSPSILRRYCGLSGKLTFDDIAKHKTEIDEAENILRKHLSDIQIDQLLAEERKAYHPGSHATARLKILDFIGSCLTRDGSRPDAKLCSLNLESLLRFIEEHIDEYKPYKNSDTYRANHMEAYENKTDDTTFFFSC